MAKTTRKSNVEEEYASRPMLNPELREKQLISLAVDLAEKQLREGTASSQIISILLKRASTKEQIEQELLEKQRDLAAAKADAIVSSKKTEELFEEVMNAMRIYSGEDPEDEYY